MPYGASSDTKIHQDLESLGYWSVARQSFVYGAESMYIYISIIIYIWPIGFIYIYICISILIFRYWLGWLQSLRRLRVGGGPLGIDWGALGTDWGARLLFWLEMSSVLVIFTHPGELGIYAKAIHIRRNPACAPAIH